MIVGLPCLSFSELRSNQSVGPVAAIGIASTLLVMVTFLPVALATAGRSVFWPRKPRVDHEVELATHGLWGPIAAFIGRKHRRAVMGATVPLLELARP